MPNYKQSVATIQSWIRSNVITIINPHLKTPSIAYSEEKVIQDGDEFEYKQQGQITVLFDPVELIELLDPETLEPTGDKIPAYVVYQALFSHYMSKAKLRDLMEVGGNNV